MIDEEELWKDLGEIRSRLEILEEKLNNHTQNSEAHKV